MPAVTTERDAALVAQARACASALRGDARLQRQLAVLAGAVDQQFIAGDCIGAGEHLAGPKAVVVIVVGCARRLAG